MARWLKAMTVRMPLSLLAALDDAARSTGLPKSVLVRAGVASVTSMLARDRGGAARACADLLNAIRSCCPRNHQALDAALRACGALLACTGEGVVAEWLGPLERLA